MNDKTIIACFAMVGVEVTARVLSSPSLVVKSEDCLLDIILEVRPDFECLLYFIECLHLSDDGIKKHVKRLWAFYRDHEQLYQQE